MKWKAALSVVFIYLIALLWLYTAVYKLLQIETSIVQLTESPLVGEATIFLAYALPLIELLLAILLFVPRTVSLGLVASIVLLFLFTLYIIIILNFYKSDVPCVCGGLISRMTWVQHIYFNSSFIGLALFALYSRQQGHKAKPLNTISLQ